MRTGYEISFTRYFYKPQPMRTLEEIGADIKALEKETEGLLGDLPLVREPPAVYGKPRIYVDTSVIGGCLDEEVREASMELFDKFKHGDAILIYSEVILRELAGAPESVRNVIDQIPAANKEMLFLTDEAERLADAYIGSGALGLANRADAEHIALATLAEADVLASWNFRHMVNWRRNRLYNAVNRQMGYEELNVLSPEAISYDK